MREDCRKDPVHISRHQVSYVRGVGRLSFPQIYIFYKPTVFAKLNPNNACSKGSSPEELDAEEEYAEVPQKNNAFFSFLCTVFK